MSWIWRESGSDGRKRADHHSRRIVSPCRSIERGLPRAVRPGKHTGLQYSICSIPKEIDLCCGRTSGPSRQRKHFLKQLQQGKSVACRYALTISISPRRTAHQPRRPLSTFSLFPSLFHIHSAPEHRPQLSIPQAWSVLSSLLMWHRCTPQKWRSAPLYRPPLSG